jgi:hypothetical protein
LKQGEFAYVASIDALAVKVPRGQAVPMPIPSFDAAPPGSGLEGACVVQ